MDYPFTNPFAANPLGSPFQANPAAAYGFPQQLGPNLANFYRSGQSQAVQSTGRNTFGGIRGMQRKIMTDYQRDIDEAVTNESLYGFSEGSDPRIDRMLDMLNDVGIVSDEQRDDIRRESEFQKTIRDGGNTFTIGEGESQQRFKISRGVNGGPSTYRAVDEEGEFINSVEEDRIFQEDSKRRARRARITAGRTINETQFGRMFGDPNNFGDSRHIQDAANTIVDDMMRGSNAPIFGGPGEDVRGRGVLAREVTNAIMDEMQVKDSEGNSTGVFDQNKFGDSQTASTILKAFAKSGMNEFDDAIREFQSSAGDIQVTVDKDSLIQNVMPKVRKMVDTLETLKDIYNEADPEKLMRIAAEVTGLNPNVGRNADKINSQVAQMAEMAEMAGVKPAQFMNQVVSTAQALTQQGFGQRMAGQTAQQIVGSAHFESLAQRRFGTDPDAGGFHAMTPEDIMRRQVMTQGAMLNERSGLPELYAGAQLLANDVRGGRSTLTDETQAFLNRAIESGSAQDFKQLAKAVSEETGQNLFQLGRNPMEILQRLGKEEDFFNFTNNQMFERNKIRFRESLSKEGSFKTIGVDKLDEEGKPLFEIKQGEEMEELMDSLEEPGKEQVRAFEEKLIEREKAKKARGEESVLLFTADGEVGRDSDGNIRFRDSEAGREAQRQRDEFAREQSPFQYDEDGKIKMDGDSPMFKDTPSGQAAKERFEEEKFVRDEQGEKVTQKERLNQDDADAFSVVNSMTSREEMQKILAIQSGQFMTEDGRFIGEDRATRELREKKEAIDADESLTEEEKTEQKEILDAEDRARRERAVADQIKSSTGFKEVMKQLDVDQLIEEAAIDEERKVELKEEADAEKEAIDKQVEEGKISKEEGQKAKDKIDSDLAKQVEEIDRENEEELEERIESLEIDDDARDRTKEILQEEIDKRKERVREIRETEEEAIEENKRKLIDRKINEDEFKKEEKRIKREAQEKIDEVNEGAQEVAEETVANEIAVETTDVMDKFSPEMRKKLASDMNRIKVRQEQMMGTFSPAGSREKADAIIEVGRKRRSQEKMEEIFAGDFTGEGGFLEGFGDDDFSIEKQLEKHQFTEEELSQAEKIIPQEMDKITDSITDSMVNKDSKTANDKTKTFFKQLKEAKDDTAADEVKDMAIEVMRSGTDMSQEEAEEAFNKLNEKVQKGEKLSAKEQEQIRQIGQVGINVDQERAPEDQMGVTKTLGSDEQAEKFEALSNALESLRESIEKQSEETADSDAVSKVTFEEGTVFQAVLSPDLKTITMRSE